MLMTFRIFLFCNVTISVPGSYSHSVIFFSFFIFCKIRLVGTYQCIGSLWIRYRTQVLSHRYGRYSLKRQIWSELGTCQFFPGSLIAKSLICFHGSLLLKRYFSVFPGSLTAKLQLKKQWFATVMFAKTLNRY